MYPWLVTLHLLGFAVFMLAHGVSIWVVFRVRGESDRALVAALLEMSRRALLVVYVGLAMLGIGGLGAAASAGLLGAPWIVASYAVVAIAMGVMYTIAAPYYHRLREAMAGTPDTPPIDDEVLAARLRTRRPELLAGVGGLAIVVLVVLMTVKPG